MKSSNDENQLLFNITRVDQIGIVVNDVDKTMKKYETFFGIEPFMTLESAVNSAKLKIGLLYMDNTQIELIQVTEGETIHSKFLKEKGEGLHHLGFFVDDIEKELSRMEEGGIQVLEKGLVLDLVKYVYLDTQQTLGTIYELIQFD